MSVRRQCALLSFNRSSLYYERIGLSEEDQRILEEMDKIYLDFPIYGSRRMSRELKRRGFKVGRYKARSLMRILGVEAIYPRKRLTFPAKEHQIYPYLLRDVSIDRPDVAYAADITYIRLKPWICLSCGCDGSLQPLHRLLENLQHFGDGFLR